MQRSLLLSDIVCDFSMIFLIFFLLIALFFFIPPCLNAFCICFCRYRAYWRQQRKPIREQGQEFFRPSFVAYRQVVAQRQLKEEDNTPISVDLGQTMHISSRSAKTNRVDSSAALNEGEQSKRMPLVSLSNIIENNDLYFTL